jgi:AbrB family looped-hinge helix DNA binding protein
MEVEIVRMSSKGQIVIPQEIREELGVDEGSFFAITLNKDTVIMKKMTTPAKETLIRDIINLSKESKTILQKKNITEEDIPRIVAKSQASRKNK